MEMKSWRWTRCAVAATLVTVAHPWGADMARPVEAAAGIDGAIVSFTMVVAPTEPAVAFPTPGSFSIAGQCGRLQPAPGGPVVNLPVSFVDVPEAEGVACGGFNGGGGFTVVGCAGGEGIGRVSLVEPSGDTVSITNATVLLIAGIVVLEANQATGGYIDGSSSGEAMGIGTAVPAVGTTCLGGPTLYAATMVLVGVSPS
jgi:hypothetical protein